jgi:hypothetical protein
MAARASGSATLEIDYIYLLPVDDTFTSITWDATVAAPTAGVVDGTSDSVYQITDPTVAAWTVTPSAHVYGSGDTPMLSPGNNRVYIINLNGSGADTLTATQKVWAWYWPRYLTVATA